MLVCIYFKNHPIKFHPDQIKNNGALGISKKVAL